tara:strand:+ start:328 stop:1032 length:705 start_codon:yes stop_codon:yes gene_type:complete
MKPIAFIFARGGSKSIKNKNIKLFNGKPLIYWTIKLAIKSNLFSRIIVSTDDTKIANVSLKYGAEVPFLRPSRLSFDNSNEIYAWKHAIKYLEKNGEYNSEIFVSLPTVSPLKIKKDITDAIKILKKTKADLVLGLTKSHRNPYFNMLRKNKKNYFELVINDKNYINRQKSPKIYDVTTILYVAKKEYVLKTKSLFGGKVSGIIIPKERSIDIDDIYDFKVAELIFKNKNEFKL